MIRVKEAILVEGRYDVNTVCQVVDAVVLESGGFRIFNDKEQLGLLRRIAATRGLIVLTDSDGAGFVIRNYLKGALPAGSIKQAYIPDVRGKERRKRHGSKEGKLGVEGMDLATLRKALEGAGATLEDGSAPQRSGASLTKGDLMELGLAGGPDSARCRRELQKALGLPERLSANELLRAVGTLVTREQFLEALHNMEKERP